MIRTNTKCKGHRFDKVSYHIPFYTEAFSKASDEVETDQKIVKIPVKIADEQDDTCSNMTHTPVKAITHFDNKTEEVLKMMSIINDQVIKPKNIEK